MANRYEQPIASEFINTYVPIPFQEMMQAGQMKQNRYDQGAAAADAAIQRAEMIEAIAGSKDDLYRREAVNKMYDIRDKYATKDLSDSFILRQMNNEINTSIDKEWLKKMGESKQMWDEAQKAKRTLAMNNKWNPLLDKDPASGWNSKEMGTYAYTPSAFIDKSEAFNPYYKDLNPESTIEDVKGYQSVVTGISDAKVRAVANNSAQELLNTPQGQQQIELYRIANPESKKSDVDILRDEMYDYGKQFVSSNIQVLSDKLQRDGGSGSTKRPAYLNLTNTKGGVVENIPTQRDAEKKIAELEASGDPTSIRKASDMKQVLSEVQQRRDADFKRQTSSAILSGIDKMVASGQFDSREEAYAYFKPIISDETEGAEVVRNQILRGVPEWATNQILALTRGNKELFDMAGSGIAALANKGVNILSGVNNTSLGELYKGYKKGADAGEKTGLYGDNRKRNKKEAIAYQTMKDLAAAIKNNETNYENDLKNSLSTTTQDSYIVNVPSLAQEALAWQMNSDGTKGDYSPMGNIGKDLTIRPEDFMITEVDGKQMKDSKITDKLAKTLYQNGYEVERVSPILNSSSKNGYLPEVEFIYKSTKSEDEGTDNYRRKVRAVLKDQTHIDGLYNELNRVGATGAAHVLRRGDLAQEADSADYSTKDGKNYTMRVPGSDVLENVNVKQKGSNFIITYQGENEPVEEVAKNRSELKGMLFQLEVNNGAQSEEGGFIPALFQF